MKVIHRFRFNAGVPMNEAESALLLAIVAAEALHGQANVRLSMRYLFGEDKRACVIDGDSEIARQIVLIFTQFLIHEFGEDAFQVNREVHEDPPAPAAGAAGNGDKRAAGQPNSAAAPAAKEGQS